MTTLFVQRFTAPWCVPCKMLAPMFRDLENMFPDVVFSTYDVDLLPEFATLMKITSVPTVIISRTNGDDVDECERIVGARNRKQYEELISQYITP